ncbi:MAG: hypothetical protein Q9193_000647 [Seirophora villosa]
MSSSPITIVGAGIAGSTLARCLKQHGITAAILERAPSSPRHSYGITLHPWAFRPLLGALQMDEGLFRERVAIESEPQGKEDVLGSLLNSAQGTSNDTIRCHRGRLETLLQEGQDVRLNHAVENASVYSKSTVLQLNNAQPLQCDVIIGADGVHSQIRKSLAPRTELHVLPFAAFNGKRQFTLADYQDLFASTLHNGTIAHCHYDDSLLEISINNSSHEHIEASYTYSRPVHDNDPLHRPDRSTSQATDIPEAFYKELEDLKDLKQPFNAVFDPAKVRKDRILHWLMRSTLVNQAESQWLAGQGVLLIGDAAHAMPILGGDGANYAIKDGVDLAQHIVTHGTENFQAFAAARFNTWKEGVEKSEKKLAIMHRHTKVSL